MSLLLRVSGTKRLIASLLQALGTALHTVGSPHAELIAQLIDALAAFFGATGLAQASTKKGSLLKFGFASLASLIAIAQYIPLLHPYLNILQEAGVILAGAAVGQKIGRKQKEDDQLKQNELLMNTNINRNQDALF